MVIKRDGRQVEFDDRKVYEAVIKAFSATHGEANIAAKEIAENIAEDISAINSHLESFSVEEIQDIVENKLLDCGDKETAKEYIRYRQSRSIERSRKSDLIHRVQKRIGATTVENSNANVDEASFSGREKEALGEISKAMALDYGGLSKEVADAHKTMLVYQHDLEKAVYGEHNCLFLDFEHIFKNGFKTRNGDIRPPASFSSACQLTAVALQCQSQVQFGGCASLHIDYDLAPFVKMSYVKHLKKGIKWLYSKDLSLPKSLNIEDNEYIEQYPAAHKYAMELLEEEGRQSCEALYHNLNTLESRQGSQVPFSSLDTGRDISPEGRLVNKWLMQASIAGIGKHHLTPIFPITIFQYKKGVNANPGDPNYDLKQLALDSMSKRIYPNWVNCDWSMAHEDPNDIDTFMGTMGGCKLQLI